ncbi:MAG: helix-turn-helix domain-containing protein [Thermoguttaceae bacterium]|nr:helix-turn-helix domain-containing protein [Thermoguttaceae bacterium]
MKQLLDKKQAAAYLNISQRTLDYFRERGNLPFHIIGGKLVRFDERELERWAIGRDTSSGDNEQMEERQQ